MCWVAREESAWQCSRVEVAHFPRTPMTRYRNIKRDTEWNEKCSGVECYMYAFLKEKPRPWRQFSAVRGCLSSPHIYFSASGLLGEGLEQRFLKRKSGAIWPFPLSQLYVVKRNFLTMSASVGELAPRSVCTAAPWARGCYLSGRAYL